MPGQCTFANIPSSFGTLDKDFWLEITAVFNSVDGTGAIIENGISGVIAGRLGVTLYRGKLIAYLVGTPGCTGVECVDTSPTSFLQTPASQIPLGIATKIMVSRVQGICSLLINGKIAVTVGCNSSPLIVDPSYGNIWSTFVVGAQKISASSCGINAINSASIQTIKLTDGEFALSHSVCSIVSRLCCDICVLHRKHVRKLPARLLC